VANFYTAAGMIAEALPYADAAAERAQGLGAWSEAEHYMRMALRAAPIAQHANRFLILGEMLHWAGSESAAAAVLQTAIDSDESADGDIAVEARLALARTFLPAARYDDAISLAEPLSTHRRATIAMHAAFIAGTAYSLAGVALDRAAALLSAAESLCRHEDARDVLPRIVFEQGGIAAQQGNLSLAVDRYREAIRAAEAQPDVNHHVWLILGHNNLGYHLLLQGDSANAHRHARIALRMSERVGLLRLQSYVLSTLGEIALARGDLSAAERSFVDALACAERYGMPERVAGLHANLGLVARAREDIDTAIRAFERALHDADALGVHHLAAQIRIWLATVVDRPRADILLSDARVIAQHGGRQRLLEEITKQERK
jgi:tetratricopeptide (TPR) repeat protein